MERIEALLGRMTLAEKIGQLTMTSAGHTVTGPVVAGDATEAIRAGTIGNLLNLYGAQEVRRMQRLAVEESRLGIPLLCGLDVLHGYRSLFPLPLAEAGVYDPAAWALTAREAAREAAAEGINMTFAPMLDVSRDPRWGRTAEGPGEDPWLASRYAEAKVRGFQGRDLAAPDSVAAVAKHYCAYGPVTAGREYASVDVSERTLREIHLPAFEAAVRAGVAAIMPAFTDLAGIPLTAHLPLLRGYLRGELGFDGVIVSDYNAIAELVRHGVAADLVQAAALALRAGVDIDMMADAYRRGLPEALERGLVQIEDVDAAVRRVLNLKELLGLFDDPYRRGAQTENPAQVQARRALARDLGARALVLLENRKDTLPLAGSVQRVALIGPLADAAEEMRGPWWAASGAQDQVGVLQGLQAGLPGVQLRHVPGVAIEAQGRDGIAEAVEACRWAHAAVLCLGERATMSGEAASRASPELPGEQRALAEAVLDAARASGVPVVALVFSGRPLVLPWLAARADALVAAWFPGCEAGNAIADVLAGRVSPGGRTAISWPLAVGQIPVFFGQRPGGRPANPADYFTSKYQDIPNEPQYAFGHGLGYGRFAFENLRATPPELAPGAALDVRVDVRNQGLRAAETTVFLFVRDLVASVARPLLELKGAARLTLAPGASATVQLPLAAADLGFLDASLQPVIEPGEFEILAGPCADRAQLLATRIRLRG